MAATAPSAAPGVNDERGAALKRETIRNRMNQRAFRSRRQEYVRELEEQVRFFQREGIKATQEVQVAARNVAMENTLLRKFMMAYAKCSDQDIDMLLVHMRGGAVELSHSLQTGQDANHCVNGRQTCNASVSATETSSLHTTSKESPTDSYESSATVITPPISKSNHLQYVHRPIVATSTHPANNVLQHNPSGPTEDRSIPPSASKSADTCSEYSIGVAPPQTELSACTRPEDSISCEEAAAIIAGLRMRNTEDAREELGCTPQDTCHIKNIALLQLMSETF